MPQADLVSEFHGTTFPAYTLIKLSRLIWATATALQVLTERWKSNFDACEFFAGYVPAYCLLDLHLDGIARLLSQRREHGQSELFELAYIGVVAYAETFFKDHFASLLNIYPQGIATLRRNGRDVSVDLSDIVELEAPIHARCGFLLAEKLDFGSPKSINSLYQQLLTVTPFSKDDTKVFDEVLARRNLLVHHGGIYTSRFLKAFPSTSASRKFADSLSMRRSMVYNAAALVNEVALKTLLASKTRLADELQGMSASPLQLEALRMLEWDSGGGSARTFQLRLEAKRWLEMEQNSDQNDLSDADIPF